MKQYGGMRAIGLSDRQLAKMITAETLTYAVTGSVSGILSGLFLHRKLFEFLVTYRWEEPWSLPVFELCIVFAVIALSVILALHRPIRKIHEMSIADTINAH